MNKPIQILIVDDHTLFRESLVRLLEAESDYRIVGHCATIQHAIQILAEMEIDLVLLDYDLGTEIGTDLIREFGGPAMSTRVILVTGGLEINEISAVINAGVSGIFLKNNDPRQLMKAIQRIAEGEHWWDTDVLRALALAREKPIGQASNGRPLTQRQARVLRGVLDGFTNKEIAVQMQVSESAIKATIQELFSKAGVKTRSQLVRVAIEKHSTDWPTAD